MGFLSGLFGGGSSVKYAKRAAQEQTLYSAAKDIYNESAKFGAGNRAILARAMDPSAAIARARGEANVNGQIAAGAAPGMVTPDGGPAQGLDLALAKGKALSRLGFAGADLAARQGFDNLASIASGGRATRGAGINALGSVIQGQQSKTAADMQAGQIRDAGKANLFGSVLGGLTDVAASGLKSYFDTRSAQQSINAGLPGIQAEAARNLTFPSPGVLSVDPFSSSPQGYL